MNQVFKIVWSQSQQAWVAVSEFAKGKGKTKSIVKSAIAISLLSSTTTAYAAIAISDPANPEPANAAQATGTNSIAIGKTAKAEKSSAIAIGSDAKATAIWSQAIGSFAVSEMEASIALGRHSLARGPNSEAKYGVAIGYYSLAADHGAIAVGGNSKAGYDKSIALGYNTLSHAKGAVALGKESYVTSEDSVALGSNSVAEGPVVGTSSAEINGINYGGFAGSNPTSTVSVGNNRPWAHFFDEDPIGRVVFQRTITNVAAGRITATSTDAINGSQLYMVAKGLAKQNYFHVNTGEAGQDAGDPDTNKGFVDSKGGALALNSLAAGLNAQNSAASQSAIAIGLNAKNLGRANSTVTIGTNATTDNANSAVVIGRDAKATMHTLPNPGTLHVGGWQVVIGNLAEANYDSVAIGAQAKAATDPANANINNVLGWSTAVGRNAQATAHASTAYGANTVASKLATVAVGGGAQATGIGATALGDATRAIGNYSLAAANNANASGYASQAIGLFANASGGYSQAIGYLANASSYYSQAMGYDAKASEMRALAVGPNANASGGNSTALGSYSKAEIAGSVALGSGSVANIDAGIVGANPLNAAIDDTSSAWFSTAAAVSVGSIIHGITRQITAVAAGTADTDAVNVAQLKTVADKVKEDIQNVTNNAGFNLTTSASAGKVSGTTVEKIGTGETVTLDAGQNIQLTQAGNKITVATKDDVSFKKVNVTDTLTVGPVTINQTGKITGVTDGDISPTSTEAVNGSQLYAVKQEINNTLSNIKDTSASVTAGSDALTVTKGDTTKVGAADVTDYQVDLSQTTKDDIKKGVDAHDTVTNKGLTFAGDTGKTASQKLGSTVNVKGDKNITTSASGNTVNVALNDNIDVKSVKAGDTTVSNDGVTINNGAKGKPVSLTKNGLNNGGNRITNVAPGEDDTDAVNVSQLKNLDNKVNRVDNKLRAGIAQAGAMANIPQVTRNGASGLGVGVANYRGESALSVGYSRLSDNGKHIIKGSVAVDSRGYGMAGAGYMYQW